MQMAPPLWLSLCGLAWNSRAASVKSFHKATLPLTHSWMCRVAGNVAVLVSPCISVPPGTSLCWGAVTCPPIPVDGELSGAISPDMTGLSLVLLQGVCPDLSSEWT